MTQPASFFSAWRHRKIVRRAILTALIVGTALTVINHFEVLFSMELLQRWPKILLTYLVPYLVASQAGAAAMVDATRASNAEAR